MINNNQHSQLSINKKNEIKKTFNGFFDLLLCLMFESGQSIFHKGYEKSRNMFLFLQNKYGYTEEALLQLIEEEKINKDNNRVGMLGINLGIHHRTEMNDKFRSRFCTRLELLESASESFLSETSMLGIWFIFENKINALFENLKLSTEERKDLLQEIETSVVNNMAFFIIEHSEEYSLTENIENSNVSELMDFVNFKNLYSNIAGFIENGFQFVVKNVFDEKFKINELELAKAVKQKWNEWKEFQESVGPHWKYYEQLAILILCYHKCFTPKDNAVKINAKPVLNNILFFATGLNFNPKQNNGYNAFVMFDHIFTQMLSVNLGVTKENTNNTNKTESPVNNETELHKSNSKCCIF